MSNEKTAGTTYPQYGKMLAKLSIVLGVISLFTSAFFVSVYFLSKQLWISSGQPAPGTNQFVDILGQWRIYLDTAGKPRLKPVGGLVYYTTAFCILGLASGLVAAICGAISISKMRHIVATVAKSVRVRSIASIALGITGAALSFTLLFVSSFVLF